MFRLSCREAIQKELYINQGVNPDLNSPVEFGKDCITDLFLYFSLINCVI
jgi:hypothetical protein